MQLLVCDHTGSPTSPTLSSGGSVHFSIPSNINTHSTQFLQAQQACGQADPRGTARQRVRRVTRSAAVPTSSFRREARARHGKGLQRDHTSRHGG